MTDFVTLKNGPTLPVDALSLAIDLDLRGLRLVCEGDTLRVIGPNGKPELSPDDRSAIVKWKPHLLALVVYCSTDH